MTTLSRVSGPRQLAAHETVTVTAATRQYDQGIDWPVSGDETRLAHGYIGLRRASRNVDIWRTR